MPAQGETPSSFAQSMIAGTDDEVFEMDIREKILDVAFEKDFLKLLCL